MGFPCRCDLSHTVPAPAAAAPKPACHDRAMQLDILANNLYGSGTVEGEVLVNGGERK